VQPYNWFTNKGKVRTLKTLGAIVVVLLALWLAFTVVGVLTALIRGVLLLLVVAAIVYALYRLLSKH
jgi:hypothetical protein